MPRGPVVASLPTKEGGGPHEHPYGHRPPDAGDGDRLAPEARNRGHDVLRRPPQAVEKAFASGKPTWELHGEPVEQGNFVVMFYGATFPSGERREICGVFRFTEDDKISGGWTMRG